jgi:arabinofuranosyltransferase
VSARLGRGLETRPSDDVETEEAQGAVPGTRTWWRRWWVVIGALVVLAIGAWLYRFMIDDAWIYLRVVRQIQAGHGPVFNAGERVEATTSPLWLWVLVLADAVTPFPLEWIAVVLGIALTIAGFAAAARGSSLITVPEGSGALIVPVGVLVLAVLAPVWLNSSTGLENGLVIAWLGASFLLLARWAKGGGTLSSSAAVLLGLGPLIRPEMTLTSFVFIGLILAFEWKHRDWVRKLVFLATALAIPILYELFRMGYYAELEPNTAITKEASKSYWSSGWSYFLHSTSPYWLWIPAIVLAFAVYLPLVRRLSAAHENRALGITAAFVGCGLLLTLFVVRVGGDFEQFRLLFPGFFMLVAPVAVAPWNRLHAAVLLLVPWAVLALFVWRSPAATPQSLGVSRNAVRLNDFVYATGGKQLTWFDGKSAYFVTTRLPADPAPGKSPSVALWGIGAMGYRLGTNVYILDGLGLADPVGSHVKPPHRGRVAHEKPIPSPWIVARLTAPGSDVPQLLVPGPPGFVNPIDDPRGEPFAQRVADARTALSCGDLHRIFEATTGSLTPGRFVTNMVHSFSFSRFRFPPEPRDAVRSVCSSKRIESSQR